MAARRHPHHGDLFTPVTDDLLAFLDECRDACGGWKILSERTGLRARQLRRMRNGTKTTCLSMRTLDRLIVASGIGGLDEWLWFTADDLVRLGMWDQPAYVVGKLRIKGDQVVVADEEYKRRRKELKRQKRKEARKKARLAEIERQRPDPATTIEFWQKFLDLR